MREGRWSGRRAGQLARVLWASLCLSPAAPLPRDGGGSLGCAGEVTMILDNVSRTCATSWSQLGRWVGGCPSLVCCWGARSTLTPGFPYTDLGPFTTEHAEEET